MPSLLPRSFSTKEQRNGDGNGVGRSHLFLNVYDLTPINNYLYWFGIGVFHSGIEDTELFARPYFSWYFPSLFYCKGIDDLFIYVHGMEYGFGAHEYPTSGVFEVEPKNCPGFVFRRSVWLGATDMSRSEFRMFMEQLSGKYHGDSYHLIAKNCNHFTDDVCTRLTGNPIPGWVNRLAKLGSVCNCLLPENIQVSAVRHLPDQPALSDGSESFASTLEDSDDDAPDHYLLAAPISDSTHSREKTLRLARDIM